MTIVAPEVNLNGTPRARLLEQRIEASQALALAISALEQAAPNPRDFYQHAADSDKRGSNYAAARELHRERLQALEAVKAAIDEEAQILAGV